TFLACCVFTSEAHCRKPRHDYCTCGNIAASRNDFDASSEVHGVALRFVNLDQDLLLGLVANRPQWRDAGPIENAQGVKVAFSREEVSFAERLALPDGGIGDRPNQGGTRLISAEDAHLTDAREISLLDDVDHINRMRIVRSA